MYVYICLNKDRALTRILKIGVKMAPSRKEVSRGPVPDLETQGHGSQQCGIPRHFPMRGLNWVGQYISMPCFMFVIGKHFESYSEYLKECHKINKIIYL